MDFLYNWEEGVWHPFITAGFGAHFLQRHRDGESVGDSSTEAAFNLGTGIRLHLAHRRPEGRSDLSHPG